MFTRMATILAVGVFLFTFLAAGAIAQNRGEPTDGRTVVKDGKVYQQRDQTFDPRQKDGMGRTNEERTKKGLAPIGKAGQPVNLHHSGQKADGVRQEVTATEHKKDVSHTKAKTEVNRKEFEKERKVYWKDRAKDLKK